MTRDAYNNVYRALMGITRGYGHSISKGYRTNNIDGFEVVLRKMISSLRGQLHKSVILLWLPMYLPRTSCYQVPYVLNGMWKL